MRKGISVLVLVAFLGGCSLTAAGRTSSTKTLPSVEVEGPIKMDKKASTTIRGKGFKPGEEVNILFTAEDGMQSDIGYGLKPTPRADNSGAWSTTWAAGDFVESKMVKSGKSYRITVTDSGYNPVAQTSIQFAK